MFSGSFSYQAIADGTTHAHTYGFYTIGTDGAGLPQPTPTSPNVTVSAEFAAPVPLMVNSLVVQNGEYGGGYGGSFVRYVDLNFNQSSVLQLQSLIAQITLMHYDLSGQNGVPVPLAGVLTVSATGNAIVFDFGANGIGGSPDSTTGDGYYTISINYGEGVTDTHSFYRLLGDVLGQGTVNAADVAAITNAMSNNGAPIDFDGTGKKVTSTDKALAQSFSNLNSISKHTLLASLKLG